MRFTKLHLPFHEEYNKTDQSVLLRSVNVHLKLTVKKLSKSAITQKRILDAAVEIFAQKGYHDTRVDDIVKASGTSKGAVYFHFPSKQDVFLFVIDQFANRLSDGLHEAIEREEKGVNQVYAALQTCMEIFGQYRHLAKIFLVQATGLGSVFEEKRLEINERFANLIRVHLDLAIEEGDLPPIDTQVASMAWMGAIYEVVIRWVLTGKPDLERALPTLRIFLLRSIGVSEEKIRELEAK